MSTRDTRANAHKRKMVAPVIVTVVLLVYYLFFFGLLLSFLESTVFKLLFGIIPALSGVVLIGVCAERIKENKGGEEDDLSQY